jgi:hypothetical protein
MRRIVVGMSGFVLAALLLGGLAAGIGAAQTADNGTNSTFGAEVSSFMQASDAETEEEVDDEMFESALNRTEDPNERRALIEQREQRLEERHQELRSQRGALDREPNVRAHAVATRVAIGASGLERSANETAAIAEEAGVDATGLGALRSNARGLRDRTVEELTPAIAKRPGVARGPPDGGNARNGPNADRSAGRASGPAGSAANRSNSGNTRGANRSSPPQGQAGENGNGPGNGSQQGAGSEPGRTNGGNGNADPGAGGAPSDSGDSGDQSEGNADDRSNAGGNNSSENAENDNGNDSRDPNTANGSGPPENPGRSDGSRNGAKNANWSD